MGRRSEGVKEAAWIEVIAEPEEGSELDELYRGCVDPESGEVDNILAVHSLHPAGLAAHLAVYRAVMRSTRSLRKVDREMVAVVVSKVNGCHY